MKLIASGFASACVALVSMPAVAADLPYKVAPAVVEPIVYGNLYFGIDANTNGGLAGYSGLLYAPTGMGTSGVRLALFGLYGRFRYESAPTTFNGRFASVDALVGWSHVFQNGAITFGIGANYQDHRVRPVDPFNPVQGGELGFKVQGDFWTNPSQKSLVLGIASYSTAFNTYYSILRFGYDIFDAGFFIGPEFGALGNQRTDQQRVGLHLTGVPFGNTVKMTISGGWLHQRNEKDGAYISANLDYTF